MFRILFGTLGAYGSARFIAKGWVETLYLEPEHHLTYNHFGWVQPWPGAWMYLHVVGVGIAALALALGFHSRLAAAVYFVGFGYLELLDGALYLNHYWWLSLGAVWMIILPVHNTWSIDVWRGRLAATDQVPAVTIWILRAQLGVVYIFAGLAKINPDWLGDGNPLGLWLAHRTDLPLVGSFMDVTGIGLAASWAGMLFDCTIVGWLLWPNSRRFGYAAVVVFHSVTGALFQIGLFPIVMIAGTLVFFEPDWPLRLVTRFNGRSGFGSRSGSGRRHQGRNENRSPIETAPSATPPILSAWASSGLVVVATMQILFPLRHLLADGNVRWTEEGYYLSWRVMLTDKTGTVQFTVKDPETGEVWRVSPDAVLESWQARQAAIRSDLLLATAHIIEDDFAGRGIANVEVRAESFVSFNSRPRQRYVDPEVDLARLPRGTPASEWLLPLNDPVYD